jgi:hypothetical protein
VSLIPILKIPERETQAETECGRQPLILIVFLILKIPERETQAETE